MTTFPKLIATLKRHYGAPTLPPATNPIEHIYWENACYLLPDTRRLEVFTTLREKFAFDPTRILAAPDSELLPIATRGGMRPETRVFRWREIARIAQSQFNGDLNTLLALPYAQAKKAFKQFPNIGDPGAEKILLFCGVAEGLPLESNGLRVLTRVGWGRPQKDYGATYRSVQQALAPDLPSAAPKLAEAHLLLRQHGKTLCKDKSPICSKCPAAPHCRYAQTLAAKFPGSITPTQSSRAASK